VIVLLGNVCRIRHNKGVVNGRTSDLCEMNFCLYGKRMVKIGAVLPKLSQK